MIVVHGCHDVVIPLKHSEQLVANRWGAKAATATHYHCFHYLPSSTPFTSTLTAAAAVAATAAAVAATAAAAAAAAAAATVFVAVLLLAFII